MVGTREEVHLRQTMKRSFHSSSSKDACEIFADGLKKDKFEIRETSELEINMRVISIHAAYEVKRLGKEEMGSKDRLLSFKFHVNHLLLYLLKVPQ